MTWKKTCKRFVGLFDIMGFKDRVHREPHNKVLSLMNRLHSEIIYPIKETDELNSIIRPIMFSDSILIISNTDSVEDLDKIAFVTTYLLNQCFELGIPIKGAISLGKFTADFEKSIYFGQPLIDAHLLQDELLIYGAAFDHTIETIIDNISYDGIIPIIGIKKYKIPLKSGKVTHYTADWSFSYREEPTKMRVVTQKLYNTVSGKPRIYVDNTMDYVNFLIEEHIKKQSKK